MSRRLGVLLLPVLLLAGQLAVVVLGQEPARAACAATAKDGVIAAAMAKTCGTRVEVESARSEFTRTFAEPSGLKTQEISAVPQRAKRRDGTWAAIDTTLQRAGVYLVPAAAASDVRFSTGGDGPFATLTHQGQSFSLSWHATLPAPTVEGDSATYAEVLPDVDLVVKATDSGFSHLLVVKSKRAAANPLVRQARYAVGGDGELVSSSDGGLVVRSGDKTVATAGKAEMWDTPANPSDKLLAMSGASPEPRKYSRVAAHSVGKDLVITPDAAMLDDPAARFPLIVDPLWNPGQSQWAYATSNNTNAPLNDETIRAGDPFPAAPILRSGNDTVGRVNRSFMRFDIGAVAFKQILDANISGRVDHTWKCSSPRPNYFYRTAPIGATPRQSWPGPGLEVLLGNNNVYANEAACSNPNMPFEVFSGTLINDLQAFANGGASFYYVGICACSDGGGTGEWDQERWMRYFLNDFRLNIAYNTKPNTPDNLTVDGKACVAGANRPFIKTTTPTLRAHVTDPDGDTMQVWFAWARWNGLSFVDEGSGSQNNVPSNGTALFTATGNINGGIYTFRSQSNDGRIASDLTHIPGNCEWEVDTAPPAVPTVTADVYLEGQTGGAPGQTGRFTFSSSSDTKSFLWGFSDPPTNPITPPTLGGSVSINYTPPSSGPRTLFVRAIDRAGNEANKTYQFYVAAETTAVGRWLMNEDGTTGTLADDTGNGNTLSAVNGPRFGAPGRIAPGNDGVSRTSVNFDGVDDAARRPALIDTSRSFSVSVWVKLDAKAGVDQTIVSQQGAWFSAFYLQYDASLDRWVIEAPSSEQQTPAPNWYSAKSTTVPKPGVWTHLVGTYDPAVRQLKIYVNGVMEGTSTGLVAWNATGDFRVGRAGSNWFDGSITEAQVWDRMISATEVANLYDPLTHALVAKWDMSDVGPGPTFDASNLAHDLDFYPQPGGPQIPPAGAGHTGTGLSLDGADDYARTNEPVLYTDQSFTVSAWVNLSTASFTGSRTVISQFGTTESAFYLKYESTQNKWMFVYGDLEGAPNTGNAAYSIGAAVKGVWTHLVGVYDAQAGQIKLFVNGALQDTQYVSNPWNATGPVNIGRVLWRGSDTDYWPGLIDEIRIYQGALTNGSSGDGNADIFWYEASNSGTTKVLLTNPAGTGIAAVSGWIQGYGRPDWAATGDFNADGYTDIVWYEGWNNGKIHVLYTNGSGISGSSIWVTGWGAPDWAAVGDFNGDGRADIIWYEAWNNGTAWVVLTNSAGTGIASVSGWIWGFGRPDWAGTGDFNADGYTDIVWYEGWNSGKVHVLYSNGSGISSISVWVAGWGAPDWAAVGDFNGDGRADIIWYEHWHNRTAWIVLTNSAGTGIASVSGWMQGYDRPDWAATGDFNGDGLADIAWYEASNNGKLQVLYTNGSGISGSSVWFTGWTRPDWAATG